MSAFPFKSLPALLCTFFSMPVLQLLAATAQDFEKHPDLRGAVIYDNNPNTKLGDDVFGTVIADFGARTNNGLRCSHGGPVCMEYANGKLVAFYANTSSHNIDGWTEYALSKDSGRTWDRYHPFGFSYEAYKKDPKEPVWVEEGLVTKQGTAVLILTHFRNDSRATNSVTVSHDNGASWSAPETMPGGLIGYPAAVAVVENTNYVLFDCANGFHELHVSTDDGKTWGKRSRLPLEKAAWYGALCVMKDGSLLAGAYVTKDENHFYYAISKDGGFTWGKQEKAFLDKKVRDPELAYLDGRYYLHGRSGHSGEGAHRFVIYQSDDGIRWNPGVIVSGDKRSPDGYSHNCIINKYNAGKRRELMVQYSIIYAPPRTSEYVFFVRPEVNDRSQGR